MQNDTQERLMKIRARCVELLEIATKRTPGEWQQSVNWVTVDARCVSSFGRRADAAFIASCSGPAEAGWCATIAAIDGLLKVDSANGTISPDEYMHSDTVYHATNCAINKILTAWEGVKL